MNNGKYILKIIGYKMIPLMVTWFVALALLVYTNSIIIRESIWDATTSVGGLIIILATAYITIKILNYYVKEEQPSQST